MIYSYECMDTIFFSIRSLSLSLFLSGCFSLSLTCDEVSKLQSSCRSRNLTGCCAAPHQTLDDYAPMKRSVRLPIFSKLHSCRASLRSDLCDARPLLGRSTSGVLCAFLIKLGHGSLVHRRKPLFRWRLDRTFTHH